MRVFIVLAVICIVGCCATVPADRVFQPSVITCAKKHNVDLDELNNIDLDKSFERSEELYCFISCVRNKKFEEVESKPSIYEEFMDLVKRADDRHGIKNELYTRKDLENILSECNSKGLNDCDYLKCIKFFEDPILHFMKHYT